MMPNTFKRILSAVMALVLMVALLPAVAVTAEATGSDVIDAAVFFSDLHTNEDDYKPDTIRGVFRAIRDTELPVSSVTSCGDAFSVNYDWDAKPNGKYTGDTSTITSGIRNAMGHPFLPVNYVWSDHDRYAKVGDSVMDSESGFIYGLDSKYANYYIYELSMADIGTNDRYNTKVFSTTDEVKTVIAAFEATAQTLDKSKPLFIASHMPLIDRRNDNGHALLWAEAINRVAAEMDVIFLSGHNHSKDQASDYYIAKSSTVDIASTKNIGTTWNVDLEGVPVTLNFTHLTAGYLAPSSTNSTSDTTRENCVIVASITESSIQLTTYSATGQYTGSYAVDNAVTRVHAHHHDYSIEVIDPTCTEEGYSIYTCTTCGDWHYADGVEPLGHHYIEEVTPPTAGEVGYTTYTCQHCGHSYRDNYVTMEHNYTATVVAPTCISAGYTVYICQNCGDRYNDNYVASLGHHYETSIVDPKCDEQGYTLHTCTNCGNSYKDTYVTAPGHNYLLDVTDPTCTERG